MGRSEAGKTTLTQALRGEEIHYYKTQDVHYYESVIDTPGEYAQSHRLGKALALYTYEADVVGILVAANEPYSLFPPNVTSQANRECIGIVTKIDLPNANVPLYPYSQFGTIIKKNDDTNLASGAVFIICNAGLSVLDVE